MNENWPEIVADLSPYLKPEAVKGDYLRDIGYCLRYLGWKKTNGTMVFRDVKPSGGDGSGQPDILLCKKARTAFPRRLFCCNRITGPGTVRTAGTVNAAVEA